MTFNTFIRYLLTSLFLTVGILGAVGVHSGEVSLQQALACIFGAFFCVFFGFVITSEEI